MVLCPLDSFCKRSPGSDAWCQGVSWCLDAVLSCVFLLAGYCQRVIIPLSLKAGAEIAACWEDGKGKLNYIAPSGETMSAVSSEIGKLCRYTTNSSNGLCLSPLMLSLSDQLSASVNLCCHRTWRQL